MGTRCSWYNLESLDRRVLFAAPVIVNDTTLGGQFSYVTPVEMNGWGYYFYNQNTSSSQARDLWRVNLRTRKNEYVKALQGFSAEMVVYNGQLYFSSSDASHGTEVWRSDGTTAGTELFADIMPGSASSLPTSFAVANNLLVFNANSPSNPAKLSIWRTDGTQSGTFQISGLFNKNLDPYPNYAKVVGDKYFFIAQTDVIGYELWVSDGTSAGTHLTRDINPGAGDCIIPAQPYAIHYLDIYAVSYHGELYFWANDGVHGVQLWKSDGSMSGTVSVLTNPINTNTGMWVSGFTILNDRIYYLQHEDTVGGRLWQSDGTDDGTKRAIDTIFEDQGYPASMLQTVDDDLYFVISNSSNVTKMYRSDGTTAGTATLATMGLSESGNINGLPFSASYNHKFYVKGRDAVNGRELWVSDGTIAGTHMIEINPGLPSASTENFKVVGDSLYFFATNAATGRDVWRIDEIGPSVEQSLFAVDASTQSLNLSFSEQLQPNSFSAAAIVLTNRDQNQVVPGASLTSTFDTDSLIGSITFSGLPEQRLPDGNYRVTIAPGAVADSVGNPNTDSTSLDFFFLNADANRDRKVNTQDFNILAANFGGSSKVFSQGNFNYDPAGNVDSTDFDLFISQYGKTLPAPAPTLAMTAGPVMQAAAIFGSAKVATSVGVDDVLGDVLRRHKW